MNSSELSLGRVEAEERASLGWALIPGVLLAGVSAGIAFPIFPQVGLKAGLSLTFIGAILAANRAARLASAPLLGFVADRVELKRLIVGGLLVQCVTMACYLLAVTGSHTGAWLLAGRLLHGPAAAAVVIGAQALTLKRREGSSVGGLRAAMSVGLPLGVVAGGWFSRHAGDGATFAAALGAMMLAATLAQLLLAEGVTRRNCREIRRRPTVTEGVVSEEVVTEGVVTEGVVTEGVVTEGVVTEGVVTEARRWSLRTAKGPRLMMLGLFNGAVTFTALGVVLTTTALLVATRDLRLGTMDSKTTASALLGLMVLAMGLATLAVGRLARTPLARVRGCTLSLAALGSSLLLLAFAPGLSGLALGLTLCGASAGALSALVLTVLQDRVDHRQAGRAAGFLQLCGDLGGVLGPLAGSSLLALSPTAPFLVAALGVFALLAVTRFVPTV